MNFRTDVNHDLDRTLQGFQPDRLVRDWPTGGLAGHSSLPTYHPPKNWEGEKRGQQRAAYMRQHRAALKAKRRAA